jgi:transcriptional regulator with PAS, ATPase and Fis domain
MDLQRDIDEGKKYEAIRSQQIQELHDKLNNITIQKIKLQEEHAELEKRICDLNMDDSSDLPSLSQDLEKLQQECLKEGIVTQNRNVLETFLVLKQYATVPSPVLILGESGTGKELFAKALHNMSSRKRNPFVPVNMGAIPQDLIESELFGHTKGAFTGAINNKKGKFVLANQGSIFLDEIGDTRLDAQVKLLRVLQEKEVQPVGGEAFKVDTRVIAATHQSLSDLIKKGQFREDLFYRLNALTVKLPPLRERKEDIPHLVQHFVQKYSVAYGKDMEGVSQQAMKKLVNQEWKGNIRELENVIQRGMALAQGPLIHDKDLGLIQETAPLKPQDGKSKGKGGVDDESLLHALQENKFEINETAAQLDMSRNTISSRFKGICFERLLKNNLDYQKVAEELSSQPHQKYVQEKIVEYHENLIKTVNGFDSEEEAVNEVLKRSKNIPTQFHPAIRELVKLGYQEGMS